MNETVIPGDLLLEILSRIPVISLLRLRCVCKQWRNLIDDPCLQSMHLARVSSGLEEEEDALILTTRFDLKHQTTSLGFITKHCTSHKTLTSLRFPSDGDGRYRLGNSCNGLLCFSKCAEDGEELVFVCNPLVGEEPFVLPPSAVRFRCPGEICYGLGYDSSIKKYKMVRVYLRDYDEANKRALMGAEVYTMGDTSSCSWREISPPPSDSIINGHGVYLSGALHWLVCRTAHLGDLRVRVLSFDFVREEFNITTFLGAVSHGFPAWLGLFDLRGSLGALFLDEYIKMICVDIWKLKDVECGNEDDQSTCQYKVGRLQLPDKHSAGHIEAAGAIGGDEILFLKGNQTLMAYNSKTNTAEVIHTLAVENDMESNEVYIHKSSLVPCKQFFLS